ncbi:MAG: hypothetical protein ACFCGT_03515 [Sandaracinaceae bacterium]
MDAEPRDLGRPDLGMDDGGAPDGGAADSGTCGDVGACERDELCLGGVCLPRCGESEEEVTTFVPVEVRPLVRTCVSGTYAVRKRDDVRDIIVVQAEAADDGYRVLVESVPLESGTPTRTTLADEVLPLEDQMRGALSVNPTGTRAVFWSGGSGAVLVSVGLDDGTVQIEESDIAQNDSSTSGFSAFNVGAFVDDDHYAIYAPLGRFEFETLGLQVIDLRTGLWRTALEHGLAPYDELITGDDSSGTSLVCADQLCSIALGDSRGSLRLGPDGSERTFRLPVLVAPETILALDGSGALFTEPTEGEVVLREGFSSMAPSRPMPLPVGSLVTEARMAWPYCRLGCPEERPREWDIHAVSTQVDGPTWQLGDRLYTLPLGPPIDVRERGELGVPSRRALLVVAEQ